MTHKIKITVVISLMVVTATAVYLWRPHTPSKASGPFPQSVYVWDRQASSDLNEALLWAADRFSSLHVLAGEVEWRQASPVFTRVAVDDPAMQALHRPHRAVFRIGARVGDLTADAGFAEVQRHIEKRWRELTRAGLGTGGLEIDFDASETQIDSYRRWMETLSTRLGIRPFFTALPSWLHSTSFAKMARAFPGFVLQVHSLERTKGGYRLFSMVAARAAIQEAGLLRVPFLVALPTYSYTVATATDGRLLTVQAEGVERRHPSPSRLEQVGASPGELANLIRRLTDQRPASLAGVVWFRLPLDRHENNWNRNVLERVSKGESVQESPMRVTSRPRGKGLVELIAVNDGPVKRNAIRTVQVTWKGPGALLAAEGYGSYVVHPEGKDSVFFEVAKPSFLLPYEEKPLGWIRLSRAEEVSIHVND